MKFSIITFGCKVNQCESDNIRFSMMKNGYTFSENTKIADVIIINSCTVTAESDRKLRQTINKIKKINPGGIIVLTGCMPQAFPEEAKKFLGIDIVIGNFEKHGMPGVLENYLKNRAKVFDVGNINGVFEFEKATFDSRPQRSRAFLKIEDGCDRFCSYCIIPYARGRVRSKKPQEIEKDILNLSENGYKEIVLVGINLFSYGKDINLSICDAVKVAAENSGIKRIRLGSLEPDLVSDEIIEKLSQKEYVETSDGKRFETSQRSDGDGGYSSSSDDNKITDYHQTFNLTKFDATDELKVHIFTNKGEEIVIEYERSR